MKLQNTVYPFCKGQDSNCSSSSKILESYYYYFFKWLKPTESPVHTVASSLHRKTRDLSISLPLENQPILSATMLTVPLASQHTGPLTLTYNMVSLKSFPPFFLAPFFCPFKPHHLLVPPKCTLACPNLAATTACYLFHGHPQGLSVSLSESRDFFKWLFEQNALSIKMINSSLCTVVLKYLLKWWRQPSWHHILSNHWLKCYENFLSILFFPRMYSVSKEQTNS